jgi:dihydropyrimidine dehydrogenase (NAD+) subunit PreT
VLVVGGGNTAIDVARELAKLGVETSMMVYRRSEGDERLRARDGRARIEGRRPRRERAPPRGA